MVVRAVLVATLLAGCSFDASGSLSGSAGGGADASASGDARSAPAPDAAPPCADTDGDGFFVPRDADADCGPLDCDDTDRRVRPDQTGAFTTPTASGNFDYDCDGDETPLADTERGGDCRQEIFGPCEGTGWLDQVPACGETGTWHRCEASLLSCDETERVTATMPCI